jgi:hypothetical protein
VRLQQRNGFGKAERDAGALDASALAKKFMEGLGNCGRAAGGEGGVRDDEVGRTWSGWSWMGRDDGARRESFEFSLIEFAHPQARCPL